MEQYLRTYHKNVMVRIIFNTMLPSVKNSSFGDDTVTSFKNIFC